MKRIIMLIGGAMLLSITSLNAQITMQHTEPTNKRKGMEIGLSMNSYRNRTLFLRKPIKNDRYLRLDYGLQNTWLYRSINAGIGIEKHISLSNHQKWEAFHGWNVNWRGSREFVLDGSENKQHTVSLGYRIGARYNVNSRFFIGAEVNPQIEACFRNSQFTGLETNIGTNKTSGLLPFTSILAEPKLTIGYKF